MRQVPMNILIIGNGRLAKHFSHYFQMLGLSYDIWHRSLSVAELNQKLEKQHLIFCLISDDALESFIEKHLLDSKHTIIHCSGCQSIPNTIGAHPLMTFSEQLLEIDQYQSIPFVVDCSLEQWRTIIPFLPNPSYYLAPEHRAYYHCLCVMAGNFSQFLWQKLFFEFDRLALPQAAAQPYLQGIAHNIATQQPLTGPHIRQDKKTQNKHLSSLSEDPFKKVYHAFTETYQAQNHE